MYKNVWDFCYRSVCSICFYTETGIKIGTLTGFRVENFIVTDEYVFKIKSCHEVVLQFFDSNGYTPTYSVKISFEEFKNRLNPTTQFENEGYALLQINNLVLNQVPSLLVEFNMENCVGMSIAIIGFYEDQCNMSLKIGTVSSFVKVENDKKYIQFEAFIKQGNSGSPVINVETGKVIGVVGCRQSANTRAYDAFKNIIEENLRILRKSEGKMNIMDIDPIQVLIANQNQLKQISKEFYKTAVMSYGFANEIYSLKNYLNLKDEEVNALSTKV